MMKTVSTLLVTLGILSASGVAKAEEGVERRGDGVVYDHRDDRDGRDYRDDRDGRDFGDGRDFRGRDYRDGRAYRDHFFPRQAPPPLRYERVRARRGYVWVTGNYEWRYGRYVWIPGHFERRQPNRMFVQGHWAMRGGHYVWIPAVWQHVPRYYGMR